MKNKKKLWVEKYLPKSINTSNLSGVYSNYHLPELNHKDIQVEFERELIDDIIQKYKKYKECIDKLKKD